MIRSVIWDFDGTLFNSYPFMTDALKQALEMNGCTESTEALIEKFMINERAAIEFFGRKHSLDIEKLRADYFDCSAKGDLSVIKPFPGAKEACEGVIASGGRNYILTHRSGTANTIVEINGMSHLFTEIVTADNGFKRKPDPDSIFYLMNKYSMQSDETMIVGDRELEVELGRNAKVVSCFFNNGDARCISLPDYSINALNDGSFMSIVNGRR